MNKTYLTLALLAAMSVPAMAEETTTIDNMFSNGTLTGQFRMFDFTRSFDGNTKTNHDTTFGGIFKYRTAELNGIKFGGSFASANRMFVDENQGVYGLLGREGGKHSNVNRMQEYFVEGNWNNTNIIVGAQELRTPMMNPHDIRAIPRTFRGVSVVNNSIDNLKLTGLYITDSMGWSDTSFVSVNQAVAGELARAGIQANVADKPVYALGATYKVPTGSAVKLTADLWDYRMSDVFNEVYAKLDLSVPVGDAEVYLTPSYLKQNSIGDETANELDTYQWGTHLGVKYAGADLTLFYAETGDHSLLTPWGDEKVVIQQVYQCTRAKEDVYAAQLNYDFGKVGINGLSAYVFYGDYDVPTGMGHDFTETDFSVTYKLDPVMKGLSTRVRYAIVDVDGGEDIDDLRLFVYYNFKLGK
ncbi:OprD family outer membrane porin [Shewanella avicenniae]|uniref:OprD family outer membrane porin n=1 Tax=Shewanella avicenniae TaxID=2814294 RepID=A0ABX7QT52_9GAMM|nr:OprD family outer membrane porin [Shewanella avicenniae]QSX33863.1 OprD family outer membrane porin [Shewanella avicenniae]